jgi:hypothetical protein
MLSSNYWHHSNTLDCVTTDLNDHSAMLCDLSTYISLTIGTLGGPENVFALNNPTPSLQQYYFTAKLEADKL